MLTRDLRDVARQVMIDEGFDPDPDAAVAAELKMLGKHADTGVQPRDLRNLLWSSIDNDDTRDLDQVEFASELAGGDSRLVIAIADVDIDAPKGSAIDAHAAAQTTTVYTGAVIFPMIPSSSRRARHRCSKALTGRQ